jgi:hypothetical protein
MSGLRGMSGMISGVLDSWQLRGLQARELPR